MNTSPTLSMVRRAAVAVALTVAAGVAQAHEGHGTHGLTAGLAHPFAGADHLLAMIAVGVWSSVALPSAQRLAGPAFFLIALLAGAVLGVQTGVGLFVEAGVALSVTALGMLLLGRSRLPAYAGFALTTAAGLLHGLAHGAGWPLDSTFAAYAVGFVAGSALLHAAGLLAGGWLARVPAWVWRLQAAGVGAAGLFMFASRI
ncbi:HupE/UreJ family protein [Methyloversatilis sp.]|uniref:HupE/UreJ family protein n=1 Tax=Methyloversatilis sp. TaxID=2569862 RepID=UPI0035B21F5E